MFKENFKLFFDMDDTIADFGSNRHQHHIDEYNEAVGTFENLKPLPFLDEVNKLAAICPENVYIISACVDNNHCKKEKIKWLKKYLPAASKENVIFTIVGQDKTEEIRKRGIKLSKYHILVDDYTKNINDWEAAGGTGIKFKNSFNTKHPKRHKYLIRDLSELMKTLEKIRMEIDK